MPAVRREPIEAVVFDVGEVIVDETTEWAAWADWLGVPRHTFSSVFGAVLARGERHHEVFQHFKPGFDIAVERQRRLEAGLGEHFDGRDLYSDARDCLSTLKQQGYVVGLAGNQTARSKGLLRELHLNTDFILTPEDLGGIEKPAISFFQSVVQHAGVQAARAIYVGDRLENDLLPARAAGLATALVHRGPWAYIHAGRSEVDQADLRLASLNELPASLAGLNHDIG